MIFSRGNNETKNSKTKWDNLEHVKTNYLTRKRKNVHEFFETRDGKQAIFGECHDSYINDNEEEILEHDTAIWWEK